MYMLLHIFLIDSFDGFSWTRLVNGNVNEFHEFRFSNGLISTCTAGWKAGIGRQRRRLVEIVARQRRFLTLLPFITPPSGK